jgi:hypothetical protein
MENDAGLFLPFGIVSLFVDSIDRDRDYAA